MIHIGADWYFGGDPQNITLYQKKAYKDGKNKGQEYYQDVAYYSTIPELLAGITRKKIRMAISEAENFKQLLHEMYEIYAFINHFCTRLEKEIKVLETETKKVGQ